jgi:hypothetical protein
MSEINYLEDSNTTIIRERFAEAKRQLIELTNCKIWEFSGWVTDVHPEFDSVKGARLITDAWHGKKPNLFLMEFAEKQVKIFKQMESGSLVMKK